MSLLARPLSDMVPSPSPQLTAIARERDELRSLLWRNAFRLMFDPGQIVCVDES